ncbi:hypothetical protein KKG22_00395 [Patescibacteria group bacterium]|nr:hypothetical protein [Patescibacteria group bacterium]MBU1722135.1 hypothetical protein [Patescibacteria group bacterium]MBU1901184.1 hypothetical protein [Patescibacteria group bacterium]
MSILFLLIVWSYIADIDSIVRSTAYLFFPVLAIVSGFMLARMYGVKNKNGQILLLFTAGLVCWTLGETIWYMFEQYLAVDPFPSSADVFFLLGYPLLLMALLKKFRLLDITTKQLRAFVAWPYKVIVLLAIVLVSYFGIYGAYDMDSSFLENIMAMSYGVGDLVLIVAAIIAGVGVFMYKGGKFARFWRGIVIAFVFFLLADIFFGIYNTPYEEALRPYIYIDLFWIFGYVIFSYSFIDQYMSLLKTKQRARIADVW